MELLLRRKVREVGATLYRSSFPTRELAGQTSIMHVLASLVARPSWQKRCLGGLQLSRSFED